MELSISEIIAIAQLVSSEIDRTNNQKAKDTLTALLGKMEDEIIKRKSVMLKEYKVICPLYRNYDGE